jgi:hypothetical protein
MTGLSIACSSHEPGKQACNSLLAVKLDHAAAVLRQQHLVALLDAGWNQIACGSPATGTNGHDQTLVDL